MSEGAPVGVLLMTYGSPATLDDVPAYLANVRGGRPAEPELVAEFRRRYEVIGGSPLVSITRAQAAALQDELKRRHPDGRAFLVDVGMRFAPPYVAEAVAALNPPLPIAGAGAWHRRPLFLQALAGRVREALERFPAEVRDEVQVLLTAHSMPRRVIDREPDYIGQLHETAQAVADLAGLAPERWMFCYQSAGHTPEEWLKPDFADVMPQLAAAGTRHVLIAPVQFLADHLEIPYDIEIGAREQAERCGITFMRTASLNTAPLFVGALADVVEDELARAVPLTNRVTAVDP